MPFFRLPLILDAHHSTQYRNNSAICGVSLKEKDIMSIVRDNIMNIKHYTPYCGDSYCKPRDLQPLKGQRWPRTTFKNNQFCCRKCGWESKFPADFISEYKNKWNIKTK